jgi:hypothetical protein
MSAAGLSTSDKMAVAGDRRAAGANRLDVCRCRADAPVSAAAPAQPPGRDRAHWLEESADSRLPSLCQRGGELREAGEAVLTWGTTALMRAFVLPLPSVMGGGAMVSG